MRLIRYALLSPLSIIASGAFAATAPTVTPAPKAGAPAPKTAPTTTRPVITVAPSAAKSDPNDVPSLRAKAERGNVIAQYNLGLAYSQGRGTPVDLPEAFVWLTIAAQSGSTGKALDSLLNNMSTPQIDEGRRRLAAMQANNPFLRPGATPAPAVATAPKGPDTSMPLTPVDEPRPTAPSSEEAKNLYDQLRTITEEKRLLSTELSATRRELERLKSSSPAVTQPSAPVTRPSPEVTALQNQLRDAQAALTTARADLAAKASAADLDLKHI
jgi:hypothetical protein